jgi:hypothetical protein
MPGTRYSARKALRPILPVRICVRVTFLYFFMPLYYLKVYNPKLAVVFTGSGRDRRCLVLTTAMYDNWLCLR